MVVFKDDPEKYDSPEMFLKVQEDMARVMELNKQINKMEEEKMLNPLVISHLMELNLKAIYYVLGISVCEKNTWQSGRRSQLRATFKKLFKVSWKIFLNALNSSALSNYRFSDPLD